MCQVAYLPTLNHELGLPCQGVRRMAIQHTQHDVTRATVQGGFCCEQEGASHANGSANAQHFPGVGFIGIRESL
jgi:hypothetical protein